MIRFSLASKVVLIGCSKNSRALLQARAGKLFGNGMTGAVLESIEAAKGVMKPQSVLKHGQPDPAGSHYTTPREWLLCEPAPSLLQLLKKGQ